MFDFAQSPSSLRKLIDWVTTLLPEPVETVVLTTEPDPCYPGRDAGGNSINVKVNISGSYTLPLGCSLEVRIDKLDSGSGTFSTIPSSVVSAGGGTQLVIDPADHGIGVGQCENFLIYFIRVCPGTPPKRKYLLIKAIQICGKCPSTIPTPDPMNDEAM